MLREIGKNKTYLVEMDTGMQRTMFIKSPFVETYSHPETLATFNEQTLKALN